MRSNAKRTTRREFYKHTFLRPWWIVIYGAWTLFSNLATLLDNFFSETSQKQWATLQVLHRIPRVPLWVWILGMGIISIVVVAEAALQRIRHLEKALFEQDEAPVLKVAEEWKALATRFEKLPRGISAKWQCNRKNNQTIYEDWTFSGDSTRGQAETLCRYAGILLMKSPAVVQHLPDSVREQGNPLWRWLFLLKANWRNFEQSDFCPIGEDGTIYLLGSITDVASASVTACIECAAVEI